MKHNSGELDTSQVLKQWRGQQLAMCVGEICLENSGESPEVKIKKRLNSMDGSGGERGGSKLLLKGYIFSSPELGFQTSSK